MVRGNCQEAALLKLGLLILDEVGFSKVGAELLFGLLTDRYARGSVVVTSNLDFAIWTEVFGDPRLTAALLDRLTHRSISSSSKEIHSGSKRVCVGRKRLATRPFKMEH